MRLLQYLYGTRELAPQLNADDINITNLWVDASYGVRNDLKVYTGTTMPILKGCVTGIYKMKNINTKRSNQGGVVGV